MLPFPKLFLLIVYDKSSPKYVQQEIHEERNFLVWPDYIRYSYYPYIGYFWFFMITEGK